MRPSHALSNVLFNVLFNVLSITSLIAMCLLLSGCPENSPPVTHNQSGPTSIIPRAYADPAQPQESTQPEMKPRVRIKRQAKPDISKIRRAQREREAGASKPKPKSMSGRTMPESLRQAKMKAQQTSERDHKESAGGTESTGGTESAGGSEGAGGAENSEQKQKPANTPRRPPPMT